MNRKIVGMLIVVVMCASVGLGAINQNIGAGTNMDLIAANGGNTIAALYVGKSQQAQEGWRVAAQDFQLMANGGVITGPGGVAWVGSETGTVMSNTITPSFINQNTTTAVGLETGAVKNGSAAGSVAQSTNQAAAGPGMIAVDGLIIVGFSASAVAPIPCNPGMAASNVEAIVVETQTVLNPCAPPPCQPSPGPPAPPCS